MELATSTGARCVRWALTGTARCRTHTRTTPAHKALTASVGAIQMEGVAWQTWRAGASQWQDEAWRLYDITGQLRFVGNWVGHSISRCRLYVAEVTPSGEAGQETEDPEIAALAGGFLGSGPAKDEALRVLGLNLFVPGEAYVVAEADAGPDGADQWFVVSGRRITRQGDRIVIRRPRLNGGGDMVFRPGMDLLLCVWTPHPDDPDEPDSPTRSAIPDLRELEAIRKREFAELDSRLAGAGLLPLPEGVDFPPAPQDDEDGPVKPTAQTFTQTLMRAMATSLVDRSSAEALVPIIFTAPGEYIDKIKLVTFWSELSAQLLPLRESAIKSLAQSLDVPAEVLLGLGDSNHWSAWQISEDAVSTQIVPLLSRIADAGTTGYLRAALKALGRDPDAYVYNFDTAPLTTSPNRAADALNYHEAGLISDEAAVEAGAFRKDQQPTADERVRRLVEDAVRSSPVLLTDPGIRQILGISTVITAGGSAGDGGSAPAEPAPVQDPHAIPEQTPQTEQQSAALLAVANLATLHALSRAGGRLVPHSRRDRWPSTPRHQLHSRHGPVSRDRADLVLAGAWDDLPAVAASLGVDASQLRQMLHGFTVELLTRGMAYDPQLLADLVTAAQRGHRLDASPMVGAAA